MKLEDLLDFAFLHMHATDLTVVLWDGRRLKGKRNLETTGKDSKDWAWLLDNQSVSLEEVNFQLIKDISMIYLGS